MDFADRRAAISIVLIAGRETSAIQEIGERPGCEDRLIFVAEAHKEIVVVGESVIDADIEVVLIEVLLGVYQIVVAADVKAGRRSRKQGGNAGRDRVNGTGRENVSGDPAGRDSDWEAAHASRIASARGHSLSEVWIEDFALVRPAAVAVEDIQSACWIENGSIQVQKTGKVTR